MPGPRREKRGQGELELPHTKAVRPSAEGRRSGEDGPAVTLSHLRDSVRLKCRQSEERKSWSRSLSSSSLVPPGKAVRFLKGGREEASIRDCAALPHHQKDNDGKRTTLAPFKKRGNFWGEDTLSIPKRQRALSSPETWPACRTGLGLLGSQGGAPEGFNSKN